MATKSALLVAVCATTFAQLASAACPYPESVSVPDGSKATTEEMVTGQTNIKQYMSEMEAYLDCLDREEAELGREPTAEELQLHNQRHNAAVDEMERVAADFNDQVRAYKKQQP
jgi:hypothetical protein